MRQTEELTFVKEHYLDDAVFYVLLDSKGIKRLVDGSPYSTFRFKPGMKVEAVLRGKGCAGEEVTELLHPDYQIGVSYLLRIKAVKTLLLNNLPTHFIVVVDKQETPYRIKVDEGAGYMAGQEIWCNLTEQKKGKLIFLIDTERNIIARKN